VDNCKDDQAAQECERRVDGATYETMLGSIGGAAPSYEVSNPVCEEVKWQNVRDARSDHQDKECGARVRNIDLC